MYQYTSLCFIFSQALPINARMALYTGCPYWSNNELIPHFHPSSSVGDGADHHSPTSDAAVENILPPELLSLQMFWFLGVLSPPDFHSTLLSFILPCKLFLCNPALGI